MKKVLKLVLTILIIFTVTACNKSDAVKFKEEYEALNDKSITLTIPEDNPIKYANYNEIIEVLNGTGVIYLGFPECPWCRNAVPVLLESAKKNNLDTIYYYNALSIRDVKSLDENGNIVTEKKGTNEYYKLIEILYDHLGEYTGLNDPSIKRIYFPTVIFVKDGNIKDLHVSTVSSHNDPFVSLNEEQKDELMQIYNSNIQNILNKTCDDAC